MPWHQAYSPGKVSPVKNPLPLFCFCALLSSCAAGPSIGPAAAPLPYPGHWWQPAPTEGAPAWEILPQAASAAAGEVILSKRNELGLLSNFAATPFVFEGERYASLEGFWQMMKYPEGPTDPRNRRGTRWPHTRAEVATMTAFQAKTAGDQAEAILKQLKITWVTYRGRRMEDRAPLKGPFYDLIRAAMKAKLDQNENVRAVLLRTGDLKLLPDHHQEPHAPPAWKYFDIWMELRSELQSISPKGPEAKS